MRFAREGVPFITAAWLGLAVLVVATWQFGGWWTVAAAAWVPVVLWVPWFFRDPVRAGPRGAHLVIAPADGRVVAVAEEEELDFIRGPARRVSVFMNVFDVHVNRNPVDGVVAYRDYRPGKFVNATRDKASESNERSSLGVTNARGPVMVRQIAGLIARRIVTDPGLGDTVRQGERLGLIRFGSRVDTIIPIEARVAVHPGDRTRAGVTVIAEWPT